MKSIRFPYKTYKGMDHPIIPLGIKSPKGWFKIETYVDTGAFISIFAASDAEAIGINYDRGKMIYITVGDGSTIPVYLHKLPISIGNIFLSANIGFSSHLGVGFNLLGRKDIFEYFDVTFSDSTKTITFIQQAKPR